MSFKEHLREIRESSLRDTRYKQGFIDGRNATLNRYLSLFVLIGMLIGLVFTVFISFTL